MAKRRNVKRNR